MFEERIIAEAQQKNKEAIGIDEPFGFDCRRCGACCRQSLVSVNAYDIWRLLQNDHVRQLRDTVVASLGGVRPKQSELLYTYGFASLAFLRAHSSDWNSLAELPQITELFNHYMDISGDEVNGAVYTYMGILLTLRPPALGGEPERAREYFEKAIALTDGRDLSAKVEYARGYAKLLYERELHDRLLNEVMAADPYHDGFTLSNVLAKEQAAMLLAEADDYF